MKGKLYLLPNLLEDPKNYRDNKELESSYFSSKGYWLPEKLKEILLSLEGIFVESEKEGRRYLLRFLSREEMEKIKMAVVNEHTEEKEIFSLLSPVMEGKSWGVVSDAGLPCLADPGALLVSEGRKRGVFIKSFPGPCSIIMALQLSGFSGQNFAFQGYLPREERELQEKLILLEKRGKEEGSTQIWIETPYRSQKMLEIACQTLHPKTLLCVAQNLTLKEERVEVREIEKWKGAALGKELCVFLLKSLK